MNESAFLKGYLMIAASENVVFGLMEMRVGADHAQNEVPSQDFDLVESGF